MGEAKRHHYVPEALMKPWARTQGIVRGYEWDRHRQQLRWKELGPKSFCCRYKLFAPTSKTLAPDLIEAGLFVPVDDMGAKARDKLLRDGVHSLSDKEKSHFIRLLLSLDARRPEWVRRLRQGGQVLKAALDNDVEVQEIARRVGLERPPSDWLEERRGLNFEDRALLLIQNLVDNPRLGAILMACHWRVRRFPSGSPELTLSDRPLIREGSTFGDGFRWLMPLAPDSLLCISPSSHVDRLFCDSSAKLVIHYTNAAGTLQADRWVFSCEQHSEASWLGKRLRERSQQLERNDRLEAPKLLAGP